MAKTWRRRRTARQVVLPLRLQRYYRSSKRYCRSSKRYYRSSNKPASTERYYRCHAGPVLPLERYYRPEASGTTAYARSPRRLREKFGRKYAKVRYYRSGAVLPPERYYCSDQAVLPLMRDLFSTAKPCFACFRVDTINSSPVVLETLELLYEQNWAHAFFPFGICTSLD